MSCPICDRETVPAYRPFCSRRCADRDLAKWLTDGYALPGEPVEDEFEIQEEASTPPVRQH